MEQRIQAMFDDLNAEALRFQELYYSERRHILHLDQQRCAGYGDGVAPGVSDNPTELLKA